MRKVMAAWRTTMSRPQVATLREAAPNVSRYERVVLVGCMRELCSPTPSFPEMGEQMRCSHSTCMALLEEWQDMRWQERYGWLKLIDTEARHDGGTGTR